MLRPREIVVPAIATTARPSRARLPRRSPPSRSADHAGRRLDVRARRRRAARCSISCAPAASKGSASTAIRPRSRPPARWSTTCAARRRSTSRTCASIAYRQRADALLIDPTTLKHLEIVEGSEGGRDGSLLDELDRTVTSMGSRLLRSWLLRPLVALEPIRDRLDAVEELAFRTTERGKFRDAIKAVQDLERLVARAALGTAGPRDLVGLEAVARRDPARADRARRAAGAAGPLAGRRARRSRRRARRDRVDAGRRAAGAGARRRVHARRRRPRARRAARRSAARASRSSPRWKSASARAPASRR